MGKISHNEVIQIQTVEDYKALTFYFLHVCVVLSVPCTSYSDCPNRYYSAEKTATMNRF